jgi:acylphosphatase
MSALRLARMAVRKRVVVSGRVQGVYFRDTCEREARAAGVGGWVRNRWDGTVEAAFEGDPAAVDRMVAWCHHGPPRATVTSVETHDESPTGETTFRVKGYD